MGRKHLDYLSGRHRWILASGALTALFGGVCTLGGLASLPISAYANHDLKAHVVAPRALALNAVPASTIPPIAPQVFEKLSPAEAQAANAKVAVSALPNPPAQPFRLGADNTVDRQRAETCLAMAVYYEAGNQGPDGEAAVAQVVLNRLRHPLFPKSVCGVVFQGSSLSTGCQFTFTCDGSLGRRPSQAGWKQAVQVADRALDGYVQKDVGEATHYHTIWVVPYWQSSVVKLAQIGAHVFYRWPGRLGEPAAYQGQYAGAEIIPNPGKRFDISASTVLVAKVDQVPPAIAGPAPVAAPARPVQVAMLTTTSPAAAALVGPIQPPIERPKGYFGRPEAGAPHLPVAGRW
jgi:spore germination cell wall hydrolase CwlJ-like protein